MSNERLGIVFCTSQGGATRETFDLDLFRNSVLSPLHELLSEMPDVWRVLCVTPFETSYGTFSESETLCSVPSGDTGLSCICTPTSNAIEHYTSTWEKGVRERVFTHNTPYATVGNCISEGAVLLRSMGVTRIIAVPYQREFPSCGEILRTLIGHCTPGTMMV